MLRKFKQFLKFVCLFVSKVSAVSIERIMEYCQNEEEDEWIKYSRPNDNWPKEGTIEFENYSCRYREATNLVLKDLNFKIDSKDKCGIVGRTGKFFYQ